MNTQLRLIEAATPWRLDERTREIGRAGVAQARAALRDASRRATPADPAAPTTPKAA
jgi:hypothetical protein